jgi:hypothetical protein
VKPLPTSKINGDSALMGFPNVRKPRVGRGGPR